MLQVILFSCHSAHCWRLEVDLYVSYSLWLSISLFDDFNLSLFDSHAAISIVFRQFRQHHFLFFSSSLPLQISLEIILHSLEFEPTMTHSYTQTCKTHSCTSLNIEQFLCQQTQKKIKCDVKVNENQNIFEKWSKAKQSTSRVRHQEIAYMDGKIEERRWHLRQIKQCIWQVLTLRKQDDVWQLWPALVLSNNDDYGSFRSRTIERMTANDDEKQWGNIVQNA